jgi:hypothetical protein
MLSSSLRIEGGAQQWAVRPAIGWFPRTLRGNGRRS